MTEFDWQPYRDHYAHTLAIAPEEVRQELKRLGMAPFASDPVLTFRPAELMVVSMKPYGAPGRQYPCGWDERSERPGLHRWYDGDRAGGNFVREADLLLQLALTELGASLIPREVPNTYAYPYRAADAKQLISFGLARIDNSLLHRQLLDIVQPKVVLCIGNGPAPSAFATYHALLGGAVHTVRAAPRILVRSFTTAEGLRVIGVPHLSYVRTEQFAEVLRGTAFGGAALFGG